LLMDFIVICNITFTDFNNELPSILCSNLNSKEINKIQTDIHNAKKVSETVMTQANSNIQFHQIVINKPILLESNLSPNIIAQHITFVDHSLFKAITMKEIFCMSWSKDITSAPNLHALIRRWNNLSNWVTSELEFSKQERKKKNKIIYFNSGRTRKIK